MYFIPFNSRKEYHRFPLGAVASGEKMIFRIVLPRHEQCSAVRLVMFDDDGENLSESFSWERMEGDSEEWWRLETVSPETGVWWYLFEFDTPSGTKPISLESGGNGIIGDGERWQLTVYDADKLSQSWLEGGIIYQIFPDRFNRSGKTTVCEKKAGAVIRDDWGAEPMWKPDSLGKINEYDFFGGDLAGVEEKLDYLASLGVSCIYFNPIFKARSNHRYDTGDYMKIDSLLGDEAAFEQLCSSAEKKGIKIILDGVFSHTGADSRYFNRLNTYDEIGAYNSIDSPYKEWYNFRSWPNDYASWWGVDILPELDETNPGVLEFFTGENGVARKWLRAGAAGWRLDVADELPDKFLDSFCTAVKTEKPDAFIYGEVWEDATNKISYSQRRRYLLGGQLDSVMNYPFANAIIDFVRNAKAEALCETVESITEHYPKYALHTLMNHIGTHDTVRVITRLGRGDVVRRGNSRDKGTLTNDEYCRGVNLLKLASVLQFTLPGVPCIYYGDEAGAAGGEDPYNRGCYPWGSENEELIEHYRGLSKLRASSVAFKNGDFVPVSAALGCIAYERVCENERVLVIANANNHDINYIVSDFWSGAQALYGDTPEGTSVHVGANSAVVLKK
ncbi:MAG: glycoside hydrolase family 13 protein [Clostridia bacterium]|nr:glycoside hydrolase family 13 protein [Clostridia bacterium]